MVLALGSALLSQELQQLGDIILGEVVFVFEFPDALDEVLEGVLHLVGLLALVFLALDNSGDPLEFQH